MDIPDDMYKHVFQLATSLTNASEAGDTTAYWRYYNELREYCEVETGRGRGHPFLWETLADLTSDDLVAVNLYLRALALTKSPQAGAYRASIQFALAERYKNLGKDAPARQYAAAADEEATAVDDLELSRTIREFLLDLSRQRK